MSSSRIIIRGACQNNLKNLDIDLELNRITVVTGVSGSGKSSLAFDTVYAEGQRRYIESFSAYARQFMDRMDKPAVQAIDGILPAIAISQTNAIKTSRSTLGTLTEITDYLKLLFPRLATLYCRQCGRPVEKDSSDSIAGKLAGEHGGKTCFITFPFSLPDVSVVSPQEIEAGLRRQGFFRLYHQGEVKEISPSLFAAQGKEYLDILVDLAAVSPRNRKRLVDSLETAIRFGKGFITIFFSFEGKQPLKFSTDLHCPHCDIHYRQPSPNLFSFNSPLGACEHCKGFGRTIDVDYAAVIPDTSRSLKEDAIKPWSTPSYRECYNELRLFCKKNGIPFDKPFRELSKVHKDMITQGSEGFYGIKGFFDWLETRAYKMHIRVLLSKYRAYTTCSDCHGTRFKDETLVYRIEGKTIADIYGLSTSDCLHYFKTLNSKASGNKTAEALLHEIISRLTYLERVGLGYLTLDRQSRTLSGGEVQRASLTTALGSCLVNTLYVLDEPSIGLHPRDTRRLIDILKGLRDMGNTLMLVEHDPDIILQSDTVIDLGPASGEQGGHMVFSGSPAELIASTDSLTGGYVSGRLAIPLPKERRASSKNLCIKIKGAALHNLKNIDATIPLGVLACITGVSGSGKSTLLEETLYKSLSRKDAAGGCCFFTGPEPPLAVILMDQSPIGKTPRSNPVTYMKIFDVIRAQFARTGLAGERGYTASTFSFNSTGGRCEQCQGDGFEKIEMQFLADVYVTCSSCQGKRYSPEVLEVAWQGRTIHDVLQMTVAGARQLFQQMPKVEYSLRLLEMVGLGYLKLGQAANTLSGGESQRLKLASFIRQGSRGPALFLFDEPTTGLHYEDIKKLLQTFDFLIRQGHSILVVEHNLEVIKSADYILDLGPEGGDAGGYVVARGTPEAVMAEPASYTGAHLKEYLAGSPATSAAVKEKETAADNDMIVIEGAREHNLKNISLRIPREKMVVITGLSGSGKSTLAFDILFAEGQRRFLETLSPYARQYIAQLQRPEVDSIRGLPPTVAIEQLMSRGNRKSTVATATEIYHYLRLLFAKAGSQHCPSCGQALAAQTPQDIARDILQRYGNMSIMLLAPQVRGRKGFHKDIIQRAIKNGHEKIRIDGKILRAKNVFAVKRYHEHQLEIVTAELAPAKETRGQVQEAVNKALALGKGEAVVVCDGAPEKFYSIQAHCPACRISMEEPDPRLFSFNSSQGACPRCTGLGTIQVLSPGLLVADSHLSMRDGAIAPLASSELSSAIKKSIFDRMEKQLHISPDEPLDSLTAKKYEALFYGSRMFPGLIALFEEPDMGKKAAWADYLQQFYGNAPCPDCKGTRLKDAARSVRIRGRSIAELVALTPDRLLRFLERLSFEKKLEQISRPILQELVPKLELLDRAGLSYLTLDRSADTLSGGEAQRMRLAAQVASNLRGVAYVLDEPTIGLHPHDNKNLIRIIRDLQEKGNSVIIVEHDEETIRSADYIIDLGPGGGTHGGTIVAAGTLEHIQGQSESLTGKYLSEKNTGAPAVPRPVNGCPRVSVLGACLHNLKKINAHFPVGRLTVVTGISGSGKTTLVRETLYKGLRKKLGSSCAPAGSCGEIQGAEQL
ncbi:MAG: excinuclease ABC subunit UvrA, partial [Pseudomonadota bacterium]